MAKANDWMPFYIGDYLRDTGRLTTEEHGAYLLLIFDYWVSGPLPDDDIRLAGIAKLSAEKWEKIAPTIRLFFKFEGGQLHHKRIDFESKKARGISKGRKKAGKSGASARWQTDGKRNGKRIANAMANGWQNDGKGYGKTMDNNNNNTLPVSGISITTARTREAEPSREDAKAIIAAFDAKRVEHFGQELARPWPNPRDFSTAKTWIGQGASLDLCQEVFDVGFQRLKAQRRQPVGTLSYFDNPIAEALQAGSAQAKPPRPSNGADKTYTYCGKESDLVKWRVLLQGWRDSRFWIPLFGPTPEEPDCRAPAELVREILSEGENLH